MRTKEKILDDILLLTKISNIKDKAMIENQFYQVEVLIDIRDTLKELSQVIAADFLHHSE